MSDAKTESGIPFEVEGETTYLSPDSAEGKALQRIDSLDPDDPTQWITVVEEGEEIDVDGAFNRLRKRGYKV
ncbi:MAG: hypothetical protein BRC33_06900 [Cyanobacteria bacterium SW_9_44_58]|nr:MAG: hypothetical protein BRC33_06900 [Cyanobacteria bacterium SW_9_44_58]